MRSASFSFTLRPGANRLPVDDFRFTENGEVRIARIERVVEMLDGSQIVTGSAFEDIYGQTEFLPELALLTEFFTQPKPS